jgi:hypothetical protein
LYQQIPTPLDQLPSEELAEWFIEEFDEELVPLVAEDPEWAVDIAEEVIDAEQSVAVNKLRVAKELNLHFDEWL